MMLVKSVIDSSGNSSSSVNAVQRVSLTIAPAAEKAELPDVAVTSSTAGQSIPQDQHDIERHTHVIGKLRSSVEDALEKRRAMEELDALRQKILLGGFDEDVDEILTLGNQHDKSTDRTFLLGSGPEQRAREESALDKPRHHNAYDVKKVADPASVLNKINDALGRINQLKTKLGQDEAAAYDRLLSFNVTVSGLNVARTQVTDSENSVSAASAVVESIMTNLRSAVIAHGGTSADVVRLVLAS